MLRRPTRSPETLLRARESPAGAGPSWCSRTSLVAQTAGHASVAEVAHEAVGRARLVPEDVRLVTPKVVADDGLVGGLSRSAERARRDHNPARDDGGAGGDVAREVVARDLHASCAEKTDPDPRDRRRWSRTRERVVLDGVALHLEVTHGSPEVRIEDHARTVVVGLVCDEGAAVGAGDEDTVIAAGEIVANNLRVRPLRVSQGNTHGVVTACNVGEDLRTGRAVDAEAVGDIA